MVQSLVDLSRKLSGSPSGKIDLANMKSDFFTSSTIDSAQTLERLRQVLMVESQALAGVAARIDRTGVEAARGLLHCQGRVILVGMGKAGLIARKIASTLCSTGTPALYLHPTEAFHGDLGIIDPSDVLLALSNSGETVEVVDVVSHVKRMGVAALCMTGAPQSTLARLCEVVLDVSVPEEGDPLGLAPMASTTTMLALGDALAAAVAELRGFTPEQFATFHPGGSLGRKLLLSVGDAMHTGTAMPLIGVEANVRECICEISAKRLGAAFIVDQQGKLAGVFTDGDLRRLFQRESNPLEVPIVKAMTLTPRTIAPQQLASHALRVMEAYSITVLPVVGENGEPVGALHLHDLVKMGLS